MAKVTMLFPNEANRLKDTVHSVKMNQREKSLLGDVQIGAQNEIVANRFSGEKVSLCPEAVAIYDVIIGAELVLNNSFSKETYELFNTAKEVFIKNWPKEFMVLLD